MALDIDESPIIIRTFDHEVKVSALLGEFAMDFLEGSVSLEDYEGRVNIAAMAWNIGIFEEEEKREEQIQLLIEQYEDSKRLEKFMKALVRKKIEHYDKYKYHILNTKVTFKENGKVDITVNSLLKQ